MHKIGVKDWCKKEAQNFVLKICVKNFGVKKINILPNFCSSLLMTKTEGGKRKLKKVVMIYERKRVAFNVILFRSGD